MTIMKTASSIFSILFFIGIFNATAFAQCPPPSPGHHRVQKGETLYRISKKYNVSVDQLCQWNSITKNAILSVCQELAIRATASNPSPGGTTTYPPANNSQKQQGGKHRIRQGETIAGLAELYGYTEQRFREFNGLNRYEQAWPGLVVKTTDCNCANQDEYEPAYTGNETGRTDNKNDGYAPPSQPNFGNDYPTWEENIAANESAPSDNYNPPFNEDPYTGGNHSITAYDKQDGRKIVERPTSFGQNDGRLGNNRQTTERQTDNKTIPDNRVRRSESGEGAPDRTYVSPEDEVIRRNRRSSPTTDNTAPDTRTSSPTITKDAARYMKPEEIAMVNEINLVRSNPSEYVRYIEEYKQKIKSGQGFGSVATCDELIAELKKTPPLPTLQPLECIYNAAKDHAEKQKPTGDIDHVGTDGSYPWDRVRRACPNLSDGGENLVGGPSEVRESVILLLVDHGIPNRGHRRTLLKKDWKYVACYYAGKVGNMPNSWVQKFGK